jgi:DNA polymerase IV
MSERVFAHVDMDAFYASVEIRDAPWLAGKPVVVGGAASGRGVVAAASYEARRFGIHSAMSMARAERLCPGLVRVPPNFAKYRQESDSIRAIFGRHSPLVEPLSLDEAFLDLTGTERALGSPRAVAEAIKRAIREETRLTASVGIAPVKFVAKIASDLQKPDGLVVVEDGHVREFLAALPLARLWGVGPKTRAALEALGLVTIGDLARTDERMLVQRFGEHGAALARLSRGEDERAVVPDADAKSYSHEETFAQDSSDAEFLESVLLSQSIRVSRRLRVDGVCGRTVQLKLRDASFQTLTRRHTLAAPTADEDRIFEEARALFRGSWNGGAVRLIGCGMAGIEPECRQAPGLFEAPSRDRRRSLTEAADRIAERFGNDALTRARLCRPRLVSEEIQPEGGAFDAAAMARGEPGLPPSFAWRGARYVLAARVRSWKGFRPDVASPEMYLRRHYHELRMENGATWVVYCLRHVEGRRAAGHRWFLEKILGAG